MGATADVCGVITGGGGVWVRPCVCACARALAEEFTEIAKQIKSHDSSFTLHVEVKKRQKSRVFYPSLTTSHEEQGKEHRRLSVWSPFFQDLRCVVNFFSHFKKLCMQAKKQLDVWHASISLSSELPFKVALYVCVATPCRNRCAQVHSDICVGSAAGSF